ncbi:FtsX-like permease family protein [Microbacterium sp. ARD32]|uniref:FtsX-like permease family protein n=1 Tax=Microbacterium sp. ARD32 TaxID=2962577 RepID=UPI00288B2C4A|nr:FtsX-like permease family protein [Microbacterium sp. ARD32]
MFRDLSGGGARWRVAARLARRQAWRSRGSSLLIVLLIALPVAGLVTAATLATSTIPTPEQVLDARLGSTQTRVQIVSGPDQSLIQAPVEPEWWEIDRDPESGEPLNADQEPLQDITSLLPPGTAALRLQQATVIARTAAGIASMSALVGPAGDSAFTGRYDVVQGRAAASDDEALVTRSALESIGEKVGGALELRNPDREFTIVGVIDIVDQPDSTRTVVLPDAEASELVGTPLWYLPDTALTWEQIRALNAQGATALSRPVALDPPVTGTQVDQARLVNPGATLGSILAIGGIIFAFVAYQIVLLAGAAFSVSARRQQRSLAMAASVGSARRDLSRIVLLQGLVLSGIGALLGVLLGLGGAWAAMRMLDDGNRTMYWGYSAVPWLVAAIGALAVLVGTASAMLPARAAAKVDVLSMLRGGRRPQTVRRSRPVWGIALMLVGVGISIAAVAGLLWVRTAMVRSDDIRAIASYVGVFAGPVVVQIGVIVSGHWLLTKLVRPLSRLGLAPRLAIRDAAANGTRSAAALGSIGAAVMIATFAVSVTGMTVGAQGHDYVAQAPRGALTMEVFGESGAEAESPIVERAEAVLEAQSPTGVARLLRPTDAFNLVAQERPEAAVTMPVWPQDVICRGDGSAQQDAGCSRRLDALSGLRITTPESLPMLLGTAGGEKVQRALRDGGAVVLDRDLLHDGRLVLGFWNAQQAYESGGTVHSGTSSVALGEDAVVAQDDADRQEVLDTVVVDAPERYQYSALISERTAQRLDILTDSLTLVGVFEQPADQQLVERINASAGFEAGLYVRAEQGPPSPMVGILLLLAATGILMLGTSAIVLGLARIDGAADDATLAAVGATPALRRGISFWQGLIIALLGSVTGAAIGLLPVWGIVPAEQGYYRPESIPWWAIATIAVGLPLLVAAVNALTSRRRPVVTRRTAIA